MPAGMAPGTRTLHHHQRQQHATAPQVKGVRVETSVAGPCQRQPGGHEPQPVAGQTKRNQPRRTAKDALVNRIWGQMLQRAWQQPIQSG